MQYFPDAHEQSLPAVGCISCEGIKLAAPIVAEQFFLLALTDPSLQMNVLPWQ
jgi:hypothetical protein